MRWTRMVLSRLLLAVADSLDHIAYWMEPRDPAWNTAERELEADNKRKDRGTPN